MGWPKDQFNPLKFFLLFLILGIVLGWFHELNHVAVLQIFKGKGVVINLWYVFATDIQVWPQHQWQSLIVVYIGGWGIAALCWILWSLISDINAQIVLHAIGWAQFAYGCVEGTAWMLDSFKHVQWVGALAMWGATIYALWRSKKMWTVTL
jgi:hypothetical protein